LVEKAESDDALIEALQEEVQSLRKQNDDAKRKMKEQAAASAPQVRTMRATEGGGMSAPVDTSAQALEAELNRMRRLCKQQVTVAWLR
jgi:FKBP-type peptidyl-prolyl cis-trans isomerase (trigger factor)